MADLSVKTKEWPETILAPLPGNVLAIERKGSIGK